MQKLILFNGIMTVAGLIADLTGVVAMNSATVAISGAILGTIDTASYIYIMRHKSIRKHKKKLKYGLFSKAGIHVPKNLPILGLFSQKKVRKR